MFGLEGNKKNKNPEEFSFDIEKEMQNPTVKRAYLEKVQSRIQILKTILDKGLDKDNLQHLAVLLNGYSALFKVLARKPKAKSK